MPKLFPDIVEDCYQTLLKGLQSNEPDIDKSNEVIQMLAQMNYVRLLSDLGGKYAEDKLRELSLKNAREDYWERVMPETKK
eukprot:CAMPEP_0168565320 /NCGR_PEP_ID=MMETSP0413-20121227/13770_1 /TAXON_ID=136452 /ORGANISM="Filamoeba nolandi, Strain NC-AS-23-1" /LENGTH=80 /DNA_ID=CAMNT_0008597159 /DNA_START=32 /DNA_END=271 /DNA_ORIENTATION=-